jgi:hypothetical protein
MPCLVATIFTVKGSLNISLVKWHIQDTNRGFGISIFGHPRPNTFWCFASDASGHLNLYNTGGSRPSENSIGNQKRLNSARFRFPSAECK